MAGIRRTWDKEYYQKKAQERLERGDDVEVEPRRGKADAIGHAREEFKFAEVGAEGPIGSERAFLKAREGKLGLDERAGKVEIINPTDAEGQKAGFYCEVCKIILKDSASYLDHVNGKRHQAALGFSMRVERANVVDVKERLNALKQKVGKRLEDGKEKVRPHERNDENQGQMKRPRLEAAVWESETAPGNIADSIKKSNATEEKDNHGSTINGKVENEDDEEEEEDKDDEMAKIMGFRGFGTTKR